MTRWTSPFEGLYNLDRPEPYLALSCRAGYRQPENVLRHAEPVYAAIRARAGNGAPPPPVLDLGCGYGALGALARRFGTMEALYRAAGEGALRAASGTWPRNDASPLRDAPLVGLDVAANAIGFARAAGFVDRAVTEDLAAGPPSAAAAEAIRPCRLVVEAGAAYPAVIDCLARVLALHEGGEGPAVLLSPRGDTPMDRAWDLLRGAGYGVRRLSDEPMRFRRFLGDEERRLDAARSAAGGEVRVPSDEHGFLAHMYLFEPTGRA